MSIEPIDRELPVALATAARAWMEGHHTDSSFAGDLARVGAADRPPENLGLNREGTYEQTSRHGAFCRLLDCAYAYRTQPGFPQPARWQSPFTYQVQPTGLNAPFFQSTVGSWEIRIWQSPADASGWANAPVKVVIPVASGEKKTILMLDNPGGGVRVELI